MWLYLSNFVSCPDSARRFRRSLATFWTCEFGCCKRRGCALLVEGATRFVAKARHFARTERALFQRVDINIPSVNLREGIPALEIQANSMPSQNPGLAAPGSSEFPHRHFSHPRRYPSYHTSRSDHPPPSPPSAYYEYSRYASTLDGKSPESSRAMRFSTGHPTDPGDRSYRIPPYGDGYHREDRATLGKIPLRPPGVILHAPSVELYSSASSNATKGAGCTCKKSLYVSSKIPPFQSPRSIKDLTHFLILTPG